MPRTETIERTLFTFDELSEEAKERARDWWRSSEDQDWTGAEYVIENAERVAAILGIEFAQRHVKLMNGNTRPESIIYWSGFSSQGDGACFEGSYTYAKGCTRKIREYAPQDKRLHDIADTLQDAQKRHFYSLVAGMQHSGHYCHSGRMGVSVEDSRDSWRDIGDAEETITQAMRDFADWIYRQLESAYDYNMSDENVDESIRCNQYEFDESGHIA